MAKIIEFNPRKTTEQICADVVIAVKECAKLEIQREELEDELYLAELYLHYYYKTLDKNDIDKREKEIVAMKEEINILQNRIDKIMGSII